MSEFDNWRVDVAGVSVTVRGKLAYEHLTQINRQLGRMQLALHKINRASETFHDKIAAIVREGLEK